MTDVCVDAAGIGAALERAAGSGLAMPSAMLLTAFPGTRWADEAPVSWYTFRLLTVQ